MCSEQKRLTEAQQIAERRLNEALQLTSGPQPVPPFLQQEAESALRGHVAACERLIKHRAEHGC
jgi:hypothetical protein